MALVIALFVLGLLLGPLLGIAVDRTVERLKPQPEHRCAHCRAPQGPLSLVPVITWFRSCGNCGRRTGARYPTVDLLAAVVFAALGSRFGGDDGAVDWRLWPYLAVAALLVVLSVIDIETHLLPNILVWPAIAVGLFAVLVLSGELDYGEGIAAALLGGAVFGGFIGAAHLVHEQGMGRGDVKLALLLGLFVGWLQADLLLATRLVLYAILLSLLGGGLIGMAYNLVRGRGRAEIPFGPALAAGTLVIIVISPNLIGAGP